MPKQVKIIDDFSGGENSFVGSRKIEDNELTKLQNLTVGASGVIRSGTVGTAAISSSVGNGLDPYPTTLSTLIKDGHNLFTFSSDRHYNGKQDNGASVAGEDWVAIADSTGSNKINIFGKNNGQGLTISSITAASDAAITTSANHNLLAGDVVRFNGMTGTMGTLLNGTIHAVKAKSSDTVFTIEEDSSSASTAIGSGGRVKGGAPGWIDAGDEPQPSDATNSIIDFSFADGVLRASNGNYATSGQSNSWWGYIDRELFTDASITDKVIADWYPMNAECKKPNPSTFKLAETLGLVASASYSFNPALAGNGTSDSTDHDFEDEETMDTGGLSNTPTITSITVEVTIIDEEDGKALYDNVIVRVGRSVDTGSSFDGSNFEEWNLSGAGSGTRTLTFTGSLAIANGTAQGIRSELVITAADVADSITININTITVNETSGSWSNHAGLAGNNVHVGFNEDTVSGSTGWGGNWEVGVSFMYDHPRRQESTITTCTNEATGGVGHVVLTNGKAPSIPIFIKYDNDSATSANNWNRRVTGCKLYMRELQSPRSSDSSEWFPQAECDFVDGTVTAFESGKTTTAEYNAANGQIIFFLNRENFIRPHKRSTYEIESGIPEGETVTNPRYKTSVVANRRLYVGNVMATYPDGKEEVLGDTMIKSVVDNYDVLPLKNAIDASVKDGDEIVRLMHYGDRILQYKKRTLYIINISQDKEYLESTHAQKGIPVKSAVVETDYGIAWVNQHGCYLYNGRTVVDLMVDRQGKRKFDPEAWKGSIGTAVDAPVSVGYSATGKILVVDLKANSTSLHAYVYDFKTGAWSSNPGSMTSADSDKSRSNFVQRWDGELMYSNAGAFYLWKDEMHKGNLADFTTKDYILAAPHKKVKLYNVYMTYKSTEQITTAVQKLRYAVDGTGNFNDFASCSVDSAAVTHLPSTFTALKNGGTAVLTDGTTTAAAVNDAITIDVSGAFEVELGDFISIAGNNDEYMKVLEVQFTNVLRVARGHPIGGIIDSTSNDSALTVLKWKQAKFGITETVDTEARNGVTCNSVQVRFRPAVATGLMVQSIIFEYRPLFKENT